MPILHWIAIGRCIRRFHDCGVCHADLNAHNILLGEGDAVYLIDFDRGAPAKAGMWRDANLVRLRRSLEKVTYGLPAERFTEADWHGLLDGYRRRLGRQRAGRAVAARHEMRPRYRFFYGAAAYLLIPVVAGVMLWRGWRERGYWENFSERFGFGRALASAEHLGARGVGGGGARRRRARSQSCRALSRDTARSHHGDAGRCAARAHAL